MKGLSVCQVDHLSAHVHSGCDDTKKRIIAIIKTDLSVTQLNMYINTGIFKHLQCGEVSDYVFKVRNKISAV